MANWFVTSTRGHIKDIQSKKGVWRDRPEFFYDELQSFTPGDSEPIVEQLRSFAQHNPIDVLLLGLDNDLEGEHIGQEVVDIMGPTRLVCGELVVSEILRVVFTHLGPRHLNAALSNLRQLDRQKVAAVN